MSVLPVVRHPRAETPKTRLERLAAIGHDPVIQWLSTLSRIVAETSNHLDRLTRLVGEGKSVDEASNFCRWLQFSGVLSLPNEEFNKVRKKSEMLLSSVQAIYAIGVAKREYSITDIEEIKRKLDAILRNTPKPVTVDEQPAGKADV